MRTRAVLTSIFASVGVLIIGWQAGSAGVTATQTGIAGTATSGTSGTSTGSTNTTTNTASNAATAGDGTYTGDDVNTRFGSVQVEITVAGGQITDVTALQLTDHDRKSVQISARAEPILRSEVVSAQSSVVRNVSGATYTSDAYLQSLQSAIDQAGL